MARVREYHQPETVAETLDLLARSGVVSVPLAGGTTLVSRLVQADNEVEAIIDLGRLVHTLPEQIGHPCRVGRGTE